MPFLKWIFEGAQPGKRIHASALEDFIDLGDGYEEDSFVDNSEAVSYVCLIILVFVLRLVFLIISWICITLTAAYGPFGTYFWCQTTKRLRLWITAL